LNEGSTGFSQQRLVNGHNAIESTTGDAGEELAAKSIHDPAESTSAIALPGFDPQGGADARVEGGKDPNDISDVGLDSLFGDAGATGDLDFDFSSLTNDASSALVNNPLGEQAGNPPESGALGDAAPSQGDLDSLLPGLEGLVGAGDGATADAEADLSALGMGEAGTAPSAMGQSGADANPTMQQGSNNAASGHESEMPDASSFEAMYFISDDLNMGEGGLEANDDMAMGELGDFDDDWFKTD
jgi:hypothetical protein